MYRLQKCCELKTLVMSSQNGDPKKFSIENKFFISRQICFNAL